MIKLVDRLLLLLFSLTVLTASCILLAYALGWIPFETVGRLAHGVYYDLGTALIFISLLIVVALVSIRFLYVSVRRGRSSAPSIDQRTDFGDIRISIETVENLSLKAARRTRGVKDLKARVRVSPAGLEITIRAIVDGESSLPQLTEEMQSAVKTHIEEITGIPVAAVSVFIANIQQSSPTFKSRVE
ncbi:alkaline shock response membrane anchor protein AmaP [Paenibacillus xerothermodurans]|uniref:Alkaline shock response membrane anchor protein AmaP n=1 Tax=Paenibacillus xerothermodurans TaxID=1977292 RepID=A0A2W1P2U3_PAEXE|nr:alkaline shock response membrane anchor protein AmaP [Paenibacillus xerothermodurans]PZE22052.1 alkaline shock response membrane anchor protein AmaP [Paenibacillus xerothermodurans]